MWELVTDRKTISQAQTRLVRSFARATTDHIPCVAGYQGGSLPITAWWSDRLGIWFAHRVATYKVGRTYWNVFGATGKPRRDANKTITCETNLGFSGDVSRFAGAIARDERGRLHLMHRGRIGGGRKGIGRNLFLDNFRGRFVDVTDGGSTSTLALLGDLDSPRLAFQVAHFVREVQRIKALAGKRKITKRRKPAKFSKEAESRAGYKPGSRMIQPSADHGLVVNALAKLLTARNLTVANDRGRDLFISANGTVRSLFEIKTSSSLGDIYQAIGQLLYNSAAELRRPNLFLVSPPLAKSTTQTLSQLGIRHVRYSLSGSDARFSKF